MFFGDFGGGAKIFGRNPPRNAMTADLHVHRLVKKCGDALNRPTLVCTSGKEITKKRINLACHNFTEKIVTICSKPTCYDRYQEIHLLHGTQHRDCCYSSQRPM